MLTKLLRKTLTFTAAFLDFSFLFQLLFVPVSFVLAARSVQADTTPYLDISYTAESSEFRFLAQPVKSIEYQVVYQPQESEVEYEFSGTKEADEQGRVEFTQAAESQSGRDRILYQVERGHVSVTSTLENGTQQNFSSSFVIEDGQLEFFTAPEQPSGYWPQVTVNTPYTSPENELVTVTFTSLPSEAGDLRIEETTLSEEQRAQLGVSDTTAYEITSSMANGSFTYDLTLPNPTGSQDVQVQYSEDGESFATATPDELTIEKKADTSVVTLQGLDHFTIFVVTSFEEVQTTAVNVGYNTSWFSSGGATITQVPSDTNGIPSSEGDFHAEITGYTFSRWDGYKSVFPTGGYDTRVDVYLDMNLADGSTDKRFDFTSAISNTSNNHLRDFIFHLGTNPSVAGQWLVSASNNAPGWPGNPARSPITLSETDWYTLEHQFRDNGSGVLEVTLNIYKQGSDTPVGSWVLSNPADVIGTTVGGNRYGWFIANPSTSGLFTFDRLAIDNAVIEYDSLPINENFVTVRPSELDGWTPTTTVGGQVNFVADTSAPIGDGILNLTTQSDNQDRASIVLNQDVLLSEVTGLSYMTKRSTGFQAEGNAAYRLFIDADGNTGSTNDQATLVFEPYWQNGAGDAAPVVANAWQTWDVSSGKFWASIPGGNSVPGLTHGAGGPPLYSLPDVIALHPTAKVLTVSVGIGSYNLNYNVDVDKIIFGVKGASSIEKYVYDFETTPADTTMPEAAVISPANGAIVRGTHRFVVEATDASGITKILFNLNGKSYGGQLVKGDGDTWYVDIDTTTIPDGVHHVVLRTTDGAGNTKYWNNRKDIHSFTIDNTQPIIEILQPASGSVVTGEVTVRARITETGSGLSYQWAKFSLESDLSVQSEAKQPQLVPGETDLYEVVLDTRTTQDGIYRIGVDVSDNVGNSRSAVNQNITIDNTAPAAPEIVFPAAEQNFTTTPILNDWTDVSDHSGISHYRIEYVYDDGHTFSNGPYRETTISQRNHAPGTQEQGGVKIRVQAFDNAGNEGAWSEWRHYYYDFTKPAAPVIGGFINPNLVCGATTNSANITVDWSDVVDNESGLQHYQYFIDYPTPTGERGQWETTLASSQYSGHLNPGLHQIKVRALDKAGNHSDWSNTCDITYDTQAPDVQITAPGAGETLTDAGIVEVTGTITDNLKLLRYYFTIRDSEGALATGTAPLLVNTSATTALLSYSWDTSLVEEGEYTLMLEARDAAGNKDAGSVQAITVKIEKTPAPSPSPTPSPSPSPVPSPEPSPEPTPSPTPSPEVSPEPTPSPEVSPSPEPQVLGVTSSGSGGSTSARSAKAPVCSQAVPGTISNLAISTTASGATLTWAKPAGELTHYALEFVRLDAAGNETGRYGVATLGNSDTTSFTIDNLPGGSAYRFELFAVNGCAPGPRSSATSALITAPGAPDLESGEVVITPNTGDAEVLGTSTDEEMIDEAAQNGQNGTDNESSLLGQVLGASTENCQATAWWWIFLPAFLAGMALLHVLLAGKLRALAAALLLLGTGFGLYETNCVPWLWIGLIGLIALASIVSSLSAPKRNTAAPFSSLKRSPKMKRS